MRRRGPREAVTEVLPLLIAAVLVIAPLAHAKGGETAEVCGAARCVAVHDHGDVGNLHSTGGSRPSPEPAAFYVVRFRAADDRPATGWSYIWVPSELAQRTDDFGRGPTRWRSAPFLAPLLADVTKGLEPYPASPSWTRTTHRAEAGSPVVPVVFGALAAAIAIGLLLRRMHGRGGRSATAPS